MKAPVRGKATLCQATTAAMEPASTRNQVARWKNPSASVLTSSPDGGHRIVVHVAHHVVPLENLVKHDAVDKAPEAEAVEQARCPRRGPTTRPSGQNQPKGPPTKRNRFYSALAPAAIATGWLVSCHSSMP